MIMPQEMPHDLSDKAIRIAPASQNVGLALCLIGVLALAYAARQEDGAYSVIGFTGLGLIALGWVLFGYVIYRRTRYVRAHSFKD